MAENFSTRDFWVKDHHNRETDFNLVCRKSLAASLLVSGISNLAVSFSANSEGPYSFLQWPLSAAGGITTGIAVDEGFRCLFESREVTSNDFKSLTCYSDNAYLVSAFCVAAGLISHFEPFNKVVQPICLFGANVIAYGTFAATFFKATSLIKSPEQTPLTPDEGVSEPHEDTRKDD